MFLDTNEPTEMLHYAFLNAKMFPIDFPTEAVVMWHYRKLNHVYSYGYLVPSKGYFFISENRVFDPKSYFNYDMLLCMKFKMLSKN